LLYLLKVQMLKPLKEAGADIVGLKIWLHKSKAGMLDFDVVIASPDAMRIVGQLGTILGSSWPDA
jgi:large subunit ribosomal protein L1